MSPAGSPLLRDIKHSLPSPHLRRTDYLDKADLKLKKLANEVATLGTKLVVSRAESEALRSELNETRSHIAGADAKALQAVQAQIDASTANAVGANRRADELQTQLDAMTVELQEVRAKLETEQADHRTIQSRVMVFKAKLNEAIPGLA